MSTTELSKYKLIEGEDKVFKRSCYLDKLVKQFIKNGNLMISIKNLFELLEIEDPINKKDGELLKLVCEFRNLIVHNQAIVNSIFTHKLKVEGIECSYKVGQYLFEGDLNTEVIKTYDDHLEVLSRLQQLILNSIKEKIC